MKRLFYSTIYNRIIQVKLKKIGQLLQILRESPDIQKAGNWPASKMRPASRERSYEKEITPDQSANHSDGSGVTSFRS